MFDNYLCDAIVILVQVIFIHFPRTWEETKENEAMLTMLFVPRRARGSCVNREIELVYQNVFIGIQDIFGGRGLQVCEKRPYFLYQHFSA